MSPSPKFVPEGDRMMRFPSNIETLRVVVDSCGTVTLEHGFNNEVRRIQMFAADAEDLARRLQAAANAVRPPESQAQP